MFFNLCLIFLHLLPLPGMLCGEWILPCLAKYWPQFTAYLRVWGKGKLIWVWVFLAASPLLDKGLGTYGIFPVYTQLVTWAYTLAH